MRLSKGNHKTITLESIANGIIAYFKLLLLLTVYFKLFDLLSNLFYVDSTIVQQMQTFQTQGKLFTKLTTLLNRNSTL
jgi:hypothetical protein